MIYIATIRPHTTANPTNVLVTNKTETAIFLHSHTQAPKDTHTEVSKSITCEANIYNLTQNVSKWETRGVKMGAQRVTMGATRVAKHERIPMVQLKNPKRSQSEKYVKNGKS